MTNEDDRIGCEEAVRRLAAFLDEELSSREATEVERHLETCRSCFSRADFERRLKETVRMHLKVSVVPEESERRVKALLRRLQET